MLADFYLFRQSIISIASRLASSTFLANFFSSITEL